MPTIPYPSVPAYPGVPPIPRTAPGEPAINMNLSYRGTETGSASWLPSWGVFESGTQGTSPIYAPTQGGELSFFSFGLDAATQVSDFPIESPSASSGAGFASYNKVYVPTCPLVTLSMSGSDAEKQQFLSAVELAKETTTLWDIYTPDAIYAGYTLERYSYQRSATRGASLLMVEMSFKQINQITAAYSNTPVNSPQSPGAQNSVNNGITQPSVPSSYLERLFGSNSGNTVGVGGPG